MENKQNLSTIDSQWSGLFKSAKIAAIISALVIPVSGVIFAVFPQQETIHEWFVIFQQNLIHGIFAEDVLYLVSNLIMIPVLLAIYVSMIKINRSGALLWTVVTFIGIVALIATRPIMEMKHLSDLYAVAGSEAERTALIAAGETLQSYFDGTAYNVHIIVGGFGLMIVSVIMLKNPDYSKATGIMGIIANALSLLYWIPQVGIVLLSASVLFFEIWVILLAVHFNRFAR